jgi:hypothetical protein
MGKNYSPGSGQQIGCASFSNKVSHPIACARVIGSSCALVAKANGLYNLKTDRTELPNLAAQEPDRAKKLAAKWDAWALRTRVKPYPSEGDGKVEDSE